MTDIKSKKLIVLKGILFLAIILAPALLLIGKDPTVTTAFAVCTLIWASARFYYFLFYVLERYVDPGLRYAGLLSLCAALIKRRRAGPPSREP